MTIGNDFYTKNKDIDFYNFFEIKTEKLVTAVYMITNFLSDKEPMKWKLREVCLSMLSSTSVLKDKSVQERSNILVHVLNLISEILSLLEIAHLSGFISDMNYSVLKREYVFIKRQIESRKEIKGSLGKLTFSESFFDTEHGSLSADRATCNFAPVLETKGQNNLSFKNYSGQKEQNFDKPNMSYNNQKDIILSDKISCKNNISSAHMENKNSYSSPRINMVKNKRRQVILQVLKDKKELTIKDISLKITDCSEKTIQRELVSMLRGGILKKTGERRWSRYSLT